MRPSLARYLVKITIAGVLINFVINFAVGRSHFGKLARVAVDGKGGIGDDTVLNAFLIGAITFWVLYPAARREGRSGRVRGGGSASRVVAWVARHHVLAGALFGFACATLLAIPSLVLLKRIGYTSLPLMPFVWAKSLFAVAVAVVATFVAGSWPSRARPTSATIRAGARSRPPRPVRRGRWTTSTKGAWR
jgi:hypothetical protein